MRRISAILVARKVCRADEDVSCFVFVGKVLPGGWVAFCRRGLRLSITEAVVLIIHLSRPDTPIRGSGGWTQSRLMNRR